MEENNSQQIKKSNKTGKIIQMFFAILVLVYLAVTIPLLCLVDAFTIHWFIFGLALILIPIGVLYFFAWGASKTKITPEQMKIATKRVFIQIGYLLLLDILYMCIFNQWKVAIWCVGIFVIILNTISLINSFLGKTKVVKIFIPFDLLFTIGLGIYMIYIIPIPQLQQIVTSVTSAFLGGALTLVGVDWTIRRQDEIRKKDAEQREKERKEEEKKKAKPIFTFNMFYDAQFIINGKKVLMDDIDRKFNYELVGIIENSNHSVFSIERIYHDKKWYFTNGNKVILPNSQVYIDIKFSESDDIFLEVVDSLQNKYYYQIFVLVLPKNKGVIPFMHTIRDIKELTKDESDNLLGQID